MFHEKTQTLIIMNEEKGGSIYEAQRGKTATICQFEEAEKESFEKIPTKEPIASTFKASLKTKEIEID